MKKIKKVTSIILIIVTCFLLISLAFVEAGYRHFNFIGHVDYTNIRTAEEYDLSSTEIDLITEDNVKVHIYEVNVEKPKGIVLMLSGITGPSVTLFYGQAKLVESLGFASILIETRGHGKSDGDRVTLAIDDVKDVRAVVEYVKTKEKYNDIPIVIMGLSMGGATAINAASLIDDIDALISLSAFSSWTDVNIDVIEQQGWTRLSGYLMTPAIVTHGLINFGTDYFNIVPEKTIKQIGNKPILFIHNRFDTQVPIENHYRIMKAYQGNNAQVWIRDSYEHYIVKNDDIDKPFEDPEYCERILSFLKEVLYTSTSFCFAFFL